MAITTVTLPSLNPQATRHERRARRAFQLGYQHQRNRQWREAVPFYNVAIRCCPADAFPSLANRGMCHYQLCRPDLALADYDRALSIGTAEQCRLVRVNRGVLLNNLRRYDEALADLETDDGRDSLLNQAYIHLMRGNYARGFELYRNRPTAQQWLGSARSLAELEGKRVVIIHEQGYGDSIQMARFVPTICAVAKSVKWATRTAIAPLLAANFPQVEVIDCGEVKAAALVYEADAAILAMDMWQACATITGKPYLSAPKRDDLPARRNIGLAWRGRTSFANDHNRSATLDELRPDLDCNLISLQHDPQPTEKINHLPFANFAELAGIVASLDAVISVDTAVAHLAGALGIKTALMLPYSADWRWGEHGETTAWYDSVRLFRQPSFGAWGRAIAAASRWLT